ncbi:hypothetical protein ACNF42_03855 [Cuniculiplasma sp. SKW3]|uniref:hypothetical protein n=1 Tax=unclassified Cuniculiplasma TaxID=2619706 RepID=UPI003FD600BD
MIKNEMALSLAISQKIIYRYIRKIEIFVYILFSTYIPVNYGIGYSLVYIADRLRNRYVDTLLNLYSLFIFTVYIWIIYRYRSKIKKAGETLYLIENKDREKWKIIDSLLNGNFVFLLLLSAVILSALFDLEGLENFEMIPVFFFYISTIIWFISISGKLYKATSRAKLIGIEILASTGFSIGYLGGIFISDYFFIIFALTWFFSGMYLFFENRRSDTLHE